MNAPKFRDRAGIVATTIMQVIATVPENEAQQAVENYLRDEFEDVARKLIANVFGNPGDAP